MRYNDLGKQGVQNPRKTKRFDDPGRTKPPEPSENRFVTLDAQSDQNPTKQCVLEALDILGGQSGLEREESAVAGEPRSLIRKH